MSFEYGDSELVRTVGLVSVGHFFSHFFMLALPPLFPLIRADLGLSVPQLGFVMSAIAVGGLLQVPAGELVDRFGGKRVLVVGLGLTSLGMMVASFATGFTTLLAFVLLAGIGQSAFHPADYALLDAVTTERAEGKGFGVHTFAGYLGFGAAPIVVGGLGLTVGWQQALVAAGGAGLVYTVIAAVALQPVYKPTDDDASADAETEVQPYRIPTNWILFGFFVILAIVLKGAASFIPLLFVDGFRFGEVAGNNALTAYFLFAAVGILVGGYLADRRDPHRIIVVAFAVAAVLLWATVNQVAPVTRLFTVSLFGAIGLFTGVSFPSRDKLVSSFAPPGMTGRSFGFVFTGLSVGSLVGPALVGEYIARTDVFAAFNGIGLLYFICAAIVVGLSVVTAAQRRETPVAH